MLIVAITFVVATLFINNFGSLKYLDTVEKYCKEYSVDVYHALATIEVESGGNVNATSRVGAVGLMQLMPDTASWLAKKLGVKITDLYDPDTNICLGVAYIAYLNERFSGDMVFCAYNAGEGKVREWISNGGVVEYNETKLYVRKINETIKKLKNYIYLY